MKAPFYYRDLTLTEKENEYVREKISEHDQLYVQSVVVARGDCAENEPRVEMLRTKIHEDYDGVVLRDEVIPNPPVRGPNGYAYIPLKEGAIPQRQKPFTQHGEKHDAMVKIARGWIDSEYVEKSDEPLNEWQSQAFAVPKKICNFSLEGGCRYEGTE